MKVCQRNEKDISKVFNFLQAQLRAKEKELLELQRADPCLLIPDSDQIDVLLDAIASLQLSTQDGSFVFASPTDGDDRLSYTSVCSTGFNAIKTLPSSVWLSESRPVNQQNKQRTSIFHHLLSLPIKAYLASSLTTENQYFHRIPMVNHLLFMPINAFKPSSSDTCTSLHIKNNTDSQNNVLPTTGTIDSLVDAGTVYSKEFWLRNSDNPSSNYDTSGCT